jgi:hypothetical protein
MRPPVAFKEPVHAAEYTTMVVGSPGTAAPVAVRSRAVSISAPLVLAVIITLSVIARMATAVAHSAPRLFPDEYIYAALARSLAHGSLTIRGEPASFPALLEPLLAAPLTLVGDVEVTYRLTQGLHAVAASLVAVPVYVIARRVGLSPAYALWCGFCALLLPALAFAPYVTADAVALPLALGAVAAGSAALERPAAKLQLAFVGLSGLATLARVQYVVLPAAFGLAALLLQRGSVPRTVRAYRVTLAALAVPAAAALALGPTAVMGYYSGVVDLAVDPVALARWAATDALLLAYAAGWVLVPVAVVGLAAGCIRPRSAGEHAFSLLAAALSGLLLAEAVLYASNGSERFQERYLIALLPLMPILFGVGARRLQGRGARIAACTLAGALALATVAVPLSGYTQLTSKQDSPFLWAVYRVEASLGTGNGSLVVALIAGVLVVVAALAALRPRAGVPLVLALTPAVLAASSAAAVSYDVSLSARVARTFVGGAPGWVDATGLGDVSVLQTPYASRAGISEQLFWNRSLTRILHLPESTEVDAYGSVPTRIASDGRIVSAGSVVRGPLLVEEYASWALLEEARLVRRTTGGALWAPRGTPRVALLFAGRYLDGWLGARSRLTVWPSESGRRVGRLEVVLSLPNGTPDVILDARAPGVRRAITIRPGEHRTLAFHVDARRPWTLTLRARRPLALDGARLVSVLAEPPKLASPER